MSLEYTIKNDAGQSDTLSTQDIVQQLQGQGEQVLGISADGSTVRLRDGQGEFDASVDSVLQNLGWQVQSMHPQGANYDSVNPEWRAAINLLPHDDHRRAYLEGQFKRAGVADPKIMGSGRDWFVFDPESSQYVALTNDPNWDKSDLAEAAVKVPRAIGSLIGGGAGAVGGLGVGSIPGAMLGAAGGGAAADAATRLIAAKRDPMLEEIMKKNLGAVAGDIALESALDAGAAGLVPGAAAGVRAIAPRAGSFIAPFLEKGAISTTAKNLGSLAETGGKLTRAAGELADNPFGREVVSTFIPGASELTSAGIAGQLPGMGVRGISKGIGSLGESAVANEVTPTVASNLRSFSKSLLRPNAPESRGFAEEAANFLKTGRRLPPQPAEATTEDILGNLGEMLTPDYRKKMLEAYRVGRSGGLPAEEALGIARKASGNQGARQFGRRLGRGIQNVENFAKNVEKIGTGIGEGAIKGTRGIGYGMEKGGATLNRLGTIFQPVENKLLSRYGAEEMYNPDLEDLNPWRKKNFRSKIDSTVVSNY